MPPTSHWATLSIWQLQSGVVYGMTTLVKCPRPYPLAVKWVFVLRQCYVRSQNIRHSVSPWIVIMAEALWAGKANPHSEYMSSPVRMKCYSLQVIRASVINLSPGNCVTSLKAQCWSLLPTGQTSSSCMSSISQDCPYSTEGFMFSHPAGDATPEVHPASWDSSRYQLS